MDSVSNHKSPSWSSNSSKQRPLIPRGVDENGKIYQEHDKQSRTKHFMSPTISATSKFNHSRKRVLGERNESFDNVRKTPILDSKSISKPPISDLDRYSSEKIAVSDDLSSKPYDPLTNYLSPRPTFLRYKPNRRLQMLLQRETAEKEGGNEADSECDSSSSSCGSVPQSQSDQIGDKENERENNGPESECDSACSCALLPRSQGDEISDSDDEFEFEEVKDGRGWSLRGAFKVFMVLFLLVISTLYISTMNSPTPSPVVLAVSGVRDGYHMMHNRVYEYANQSRLSYGRHDRIIEEEKAVDVRMEEESSNEFKEKENDRVVEEMAEDGVGEEEEEEEIVELEEEGEGEVDDTFEAGDDEEIFELQQEEEWVEIMDSVDGSNILDFSDPEIEEVSLFEQVVEEPSSVVADALEKERFVPESIIEGIFERERVPIGNVTDDVHRIEDVGGNNMIKGIETVQIESVLKAAVIAFFVVLSSFIASRVHSRKSRIAREKNTSPTSPPVVDEPCFESVSAHEEEKRPIESASAAAADFGIPKSLMNAMEEASKGTKERPSVSLSRESRAAPIIELLGELELSEMSTSLRSCGIKNSKVFEIEVNSISVSMEKAKIGTKPLHVSTFSSLSYPDEKKQPMKKKEKEGDTEGKNMLTTPTPIRRSSRIRNRALSP
ncbi:hypothetical protein M5689_021782 [Euphorbia peplus]|nr:hypothetical protein M5689_021782 [Euphorbia peplus]